MRLLLNRSLDSTLLAAAAVAACSESFSRLLGNRYIFEQQLQPEKREKHVCCQKKNYKRVHRHKHNTLNSVSCSQSRNIRFFSSLIFRRCDQTINEKKFVIIKGS